MAPQQFILASASPRRRELLALFGFPFGTAAAGLDETPFPGEAPLPYVRRLALEKGAGVKAGDDAWLLSADTVVEEGGKLLGKPANDLEARETLTSLRGKDHWVHTAFSLRDGQQGGALLGFCSTRVRMREYGDDEMAVYIASGDYADKAGGYAIQNAAFHPASVPEGCYANVMGLPLCHLQRLFDVAGLQTQGDIRSRCQACLGIHCEYHPVVELEVSAGGAL